MMSQSFDWGGPNLNPQDQVLVEAYQQVGRALDDLPYTRDFDRLHQILGWDNSDDAVRHATWKRLLTLRKRGLLPRLVGPGSSEGEAGAREAG